MAVVSGFRFRVRLWWTTVPLAKVASRTFTVSLTFALLVLALLPTWAAQQPETFVPPRIASAVLPTSPPPNVIGGGEVLVEAVIDRSGTVTRPVLLRSTPPYAQLMLDAIVRWRFLPARAANPQGEEATVDAPVLIAAVYRPPTLFIGPTAGDPPKDLAVASREVPSPFALIAPAYPPNAASRRDGGAVIRSDDRRDGCNAERASQL